MDDWTTGGDSWEALLSPTSRSVALSERVERARALLASLGLPKGGAYPLRLAFKAGLADMAPALIAMGVGSARDAMGSQPLLTGLMETQASEEEMANAARALLAAGHSALDVSGKWGSAAQMAALRGNAPGLRALAAAGVDLSQAGPGEGSALWGLASCLGQDADAAEMARELISLGVDPNAEREGVSVLVEACLSCRPKMALALLAAGARVNSLSKIGESELACAARNEFRCEEMGALFAALLSAGADPDFKGLLSSSAREVCARIDHRPGGCKETLVAWDEARALAQSVQPGGARAPGLRI